MSKVLPLLGAWALALGGCQPLPWGTRPRVTPAPSRPESPRQWLFGASTSEVEADLDAVEAGAEGVRAVLTALPEKERLRVLERWRGAARVPSLTVPLPLSRGGVKLVPTQMEPRAPMELLSLLRGLYVALGSRDLALAAFFVGPETVTRACERLKLPPEDITLEKLASRLPGREQGGLRSAREARTWATLYGLFWPVERDWRVTSGFGPRVSPIPGGSTAHRGVDIGVPVGTAVRAPAEGVVVGVREGDTNGRWLELLHEGGVRTVYCHLSLVEVKEGQKVVAGELLARSGQTGRVTGPHLHYQVQHAGAWVDPLRIRASARLVAEPWPLDLPSASAPAAMR